MNLREKLDQVDVDWRGELETFLKTGEASDEFFNFMDGDEKCQAAVDFAFEQQAQGFEELAREIAVARLDKLEPDRGKAVGGALPIHRQANLSGSNPTLAGPIETTCTVEEGGEVRTFKIRLESAQDAAATAAGPAKPAAPPKEGSTAVFSPFNGKVELVEMKAKIGDMVKEGQIVAAVEAMKAKHDVRAPKDGKVSSIDAEIGADIWAGQPIITLD